MVNCRLCGRHFASDEIAAMADPTSFEARYERIRELDAGGMGTVWVVRDRKTGERLATKTILPRYLNNALVVRRFRREIRLACQIQHANVVRVRDHFLDRAEIIYVMELMAGGDLCKAINDSGAPVAQLLSVFKDTVAGLEHVHSSGIVHRDLKPSNILISGDGRGLISDFGLAVLLERGTTTLTADNQFLGTRHYAAPEQADSKDADWRADLYALGLIAYEIAQRVSPYRSVVLADLHPAFQNVLANVLKQNRDQRTASLSDVADALQMHLESVHGPLLPRPGPAPGELGDANVPAVQAAINATREKAARLEEKVRQRELRRFRDNQKTRRLKEAFDGLLVQFDGIVQRFNRELGAEAVKALQHSDLRVTYALPNNAWIECELYERLESEIELRQGLLLGGGVSTLHGAS